MQHKFQKTWKLLILAALLFSVLLAPLVSQAETAQGNTIVSVDPKLLATLPSTDEWAESWWIAALAAAILMIGVITTLLILRSGGGGAPKLYIEGRNPTFAGKQFALNQTLLFGRDKDKCQVVFPGNAEGVSHIHCKVELRNHNAFLSDVGSTYGTYVNDRKLGVGEVYELRVGDVFSLAAAQKNSFSLVHKEV